MTVLSNLYVEKVIAEHPIAVWMLNEQVDYISLITDSNRQIYTGGQWTVTGATATLESSPPAEVPFSNSVTTKISGAVNVTATITNAVGDGTQITYTAANTFSAGQLVDITGLTITSGASLNLSNAIIATASSTQFTVLSQTIGTATLQNGLAKRRIVGKSVFALPTASMDSSLSNFCISGYLYVDGGFVDSFAFGYQYDDSVSGLTYYVEEIIDINAFNVDQWIHFAKTFEQPPVGSTNVKMMFRTINSNAGSAGDYDFYINGLSLGQWSEDFTHISLGTTGSTISSSIDLPSTLKVIDAPAYGSSSKTGYYVVGDAKPFAKNFGVPLVYGSSNVTKIYPNVVGGTTYPSLIFPGYGFLNQSGKYNEYTAEMWISVNSDASTPRRIFGPISGTDGLYIEGGFLTFVIGKKFASYFVGEWYRPMLIHVRLIRDNVTVLVNGEEVINIPFIDSDVSYPSEFNGVKNRNWLGFYAYADTQPFSVDSFALYSYPVPNEVAKRRFVWGQGVTPPELQNSFLNSTTAYADYSFSDYAVNYNYPNFANFRQGYYSNVLANTTSLELPEYSLPTFYLGSKNQQTWYDNMQTAESAFTDKAFWFRPDVSWNSETCYIYFDKLATLNDNVESFYGLFELTNTAINNQVLIKAINNITNDYLLVKVDGATLKYIVNISGVETILKTDTLTINTKFVAGINLTNFAKQNVLGINKLLSDQFNVSVYLGGDTTNTFTGYIYKFGFDALYNNNKVKALYNDNGIFLYSNSSNILSHTSNYTLVPIQKYGTFFADIAIAGYWEDYVPLSYFAKYVRDYEEEQHYDLDQIQFNVDYPEPIETSAIESVSSWSYQDLLNEFSNPDILTYEDLANSYYTTWDDYEDMSQNSIKYYYYDTSTASVRTFVSFQKIINGANENLVNFTNFDVPRVSGVLDTDAVTTPWEDTAFEVVDGTIIYPPKKYNDLTDVDFNDLALVSHIEFKIDGIIHNPIRLRDLELASQVYERTSLTEIGTKYGVPIFPYHKTGLFYDYKGENPIEVYKDSTPHLFLTRHSGWRMKGEFSPNLDRGILIPVNKEKELNFNISSLQLWVKFAGLEFPNVEMRVFSISHKNGDFDFYLVGDSSTQRGYIYAKNRETDAIETSFQYHINGQLVDSPYLINEEWYCLGIAFTELVDFSEYSGFISLNGPMTYNNVSFSVATNLELEQRVTNNSWSAVSASGTWDYWENSFIWDNVFILDVSNVYDIDPSDIYARYVGTNKIIFDDSTEGILVDPEKFKIFGDVGWSTAVKTPV
jgi:hypothetical protein